MTHLQLTWEYPPLKTSPWPRGIMGSMENTQPPENKNGTIQRRSGQMGLRDWPKQTIQWSTALSALDYLTLAVFNNAKDCVKKWETAI